MPAVILVYWRDIPAQVIVGKGRKAAKQQLPERFEKAIDLCAMKTNASDNDAYLAEWRRAEPYFVEGDPVTIARQTAQELESRYDIKALRRLIETDGWNR